MKKGARLAIVAGIIIAIAAGATIMAVSTPESNLTSSEGNGSNSTNITPRQIIVELNESLTVGAE